MGQMGSSNLVTSKKGNVVLQAEEGRVVDVLQDSV